ncbi:hypothetical protein [Arenimonas sp.]|uniref:hypothetical protein n=1 Tax=Arenimonas sp. TaxID=1872635 RepID=UPI0039E48181
MARKTAPRNTRTKATSSRDFFLAGIGAFSLGRKQALKAYQQGVGSLCDLRGKAEEAVSEFEANARKFGKQARSRIAPAQKKAIAFIDEARTQANKRLSPVLARLGVKPAPAKRAARKTTRRPAARKRARRAA